MRGRLWPLADPLLRRCTSIRAILPVLSLPLTLPPLLPLDFPPMGIISHGIICSVSLMIRAR